MVKESDDALFETNVELLGQAPEVLYDAEDGDATDRAKELEATCELVLALIDVKILEELGDLAVLVATVTTLVDLVE